MSNAVGSRRKDIYPLKLIGVNFQIELCSQELTFDFEEYRGRYLLPENLYINSESLRSTRELGELFKAVLGVGSQKMSLRSYQGT